MHRPLQSWQISLIKGHFFEWDHIQISYALTKIVHDRVPLQLKSLVAIPLKDKFRFRRMYQEHFTCACMSEQNGIRYIITEGECRHCLMDLNASDEDEEPVPPDSGV